MTLEIDESTYLIWMAAKQWKYHERSGFKDDHGQHRHQFLKRAQEGVAGGLPGGVWIVCLWGRWLWGLCG